MLISLYLLAHLIGDFPLQSDRMVALKAKRPWYVSSLVPHALVHFFLAVLFTLPYMVAAQQGWRIIGASVVITLLHLVIDFGKVRIDGQVKDCGGFSTWINNMVLRLVPAPHSGASARNREDEAKSARKQEARSAWPTEHEARSASPTDREVRSASPTDREVRRATPTEHEVRRATPTDHEARSASPTDHDVRRATPTDHDVRRATPTDHDVRRATPTDHDIRFTRLGLFVMDQLAHVAAIAFAVWLFEPGLLARTMHYPAAVIAGQHPFLSPAQSMLAIVIVLLYATTVSGVMVHTLASPTPAAETSVPGQEPEVPRGKLIGYLERIFVVCALCMGAYTIIPLIVGAKSLVRFKKFDSPQWAEYFLVGTLGSILCGTLSGLALRFLLHL